MCLVQSPVTPSFSAPLVSSTILGVSLFKKYLLNDRNLIFYVKFPQKQTLDQVFLSESFTWAVIPRSTGGCREERRKFGELPVQCGLENYLPLRAVVAHSCWYSL